jgi:anti-anti-sigma regulatory factor
MAVDMWRTRAANMNTPLEFGTLATGEQRILTVKGELDMAVCAPFEHALLDAIATTRPVGELVVT